MSTYSFTSAEYGIVAGRTFKLTGTITRSGSTTNVSFQVYPQYSVQINCKFAVFWKTGSSTVSSGSVDAVSGWTKAGSTKTVYIDNLSSQGTAGNDDYSKTWKSDTITTGNFDTGTGVISIAIAFYLSSYTDITTGASKTDLNEVKTIKQGVDAEYTAPKNSVLTITARTADSLTVKGTWTSGSKASSEKFNIQINDKDSKTVTATLTTSGSTHKFTNLSSNLNYTSLQGSLTDGTTTLSTVKPDYPYTLPLITDIEQVSGTKTDTSIQLKIIPERKRSDGSDMYAMKVVKDGQTAPTSYTYKTSDTQIFSFTGLEPNTKYQAYASMKGGLSNSSVSLIDTYHESLTTYHTPIAGLKVALVDSWFHYLKIKTTNTNTNGNTISKYEFAISKTSTSTPSYKSTSTTNAYELSNLEANTTYYCYARITDGHSRTYTASSTFKTLDNRSVYIINEDNPDGVLKPLNIITTTGELTIYPNDITIIKSDGTELNMNKIINNDDRTSH